MSPIVVLISGANRGIGKGLLAIYLAKPDHTVIAFNRNPDHTTSKALADLPRGAGTRLLVVKADASVETDAAGAVAQLMAQGIGHIDTVIANAGIAAVFPKVSEVRVADTDSYGDQRLWRGVPVLGDLVIAEELGQAQVDYHWIFCGLD